MKHDDLKNETVPQAVSVVWSFQKRIVASIFIIVLHKQSLRSLLFPVENSKQQILPEGRFHLTPNTRLNEAKFRGIDLSEIVIRHCIE